MKILIAPDSYKESIDAFGAAEAMAEGAKRAIPEAEIDLCPMSDGGDGFLDVLVRASQGSVRNVTIPGPLGHPVEAQFGLLRGKSMAVVETAQASGLVLVPRHLRNPLNTTSFGTGRLIQAALDHEVQILVIGLGGSAFVDAGCGCLQALGVLFFNRQGKPLERPMTGRDLGNLADFDASPIDGRLRSVTVRCACDVSNPLVGPEGAARIFGPQKGAGPEEVEILEKNLGIWADLVLRKTGLDVRQGKYTGAAGGLGAGLAVFLGASLESGFDIVSETAGLEGRIREADLCLTGEGRLDQTSLSGKTTGRLAGICRRMGKPVICIPGQMEDGLVFDCFDRIVELARKEKSSEGRFAHVRENLADAAFRAVKDFSAVFGMG